MITSLHGQLVFSLSPATKTYWAQRQSLWQLDGVPHSNWETPICDKIVKQPVLPHGFHQEVLSQLHKLHEQWTSKTLGKVQERF